LRQVAQRDKRPENQRRVPVMPTSVHDAVAPTVILDLLRVMNPQGVDVGPQSDLASGSGAITCLPICEHSTAFGTDANFESHVAQSLVQMQTSTPFVPGYFRILVQMAAETDDLLEPIVNQSIHYSLPRAAHPDSSTAVQGVNNLPAQF
jgi:hypothetical protein